MNDIINTLSRLGFINTEQIMQALLAGNNYILTLTYNLSRIATLQHAAMQNSFSVVLSVPCSAFRSLLLPTKK